MPSNSCRETGSRPSSTLPRPWLSKLRDLPVLMLADPEGRVSLPCVSSPALGWLSSRLPVPLRTDPKSRWKRSLSRTHRGGLKNDSCSPSARNNVYTEERVWWPHASAATSSTRQVTTEGLRRSPLLCRPGGRLRAQEGPALIVLTYTNPST